MEQDMLIAIDDHQLDAISGGTGDPGGGGACKLDPCALLTDLKSSADAFITDASSAACGAIGSAIEAKKAALGALFGGCG